MLVAFLACLIALAAVLLALWHEEPLATPQVASPRWDPLPAPLDVARVRFPLSFPGYEPATVEAAFHALNRAYTQLLEESPPDVVAQVRRRLGPEAEPPIATPPQPEEDPATSVDGADGPQQPDEDRADAASEDSAGSADATDADADDVRMGGEDSDDEEPRND